MKIQLQALLSAAILFAPTLARAADAAPAAARLELLMGPGTEQCIGQNALRRAVEFRLQRPAFRRDVRATLYLRVVMTREAVGWAANLTLHDGTGTFLGQRSILTAAPHCSALDDSLALVVALLVEAPPMAAPAEAGSLHTATAVPSVSAVTADPMIPSLVPRVARPRSVPTLHLPRDTPAEREPWRFTIAFEAIAALGLLPGLSPGGELSLGAKVRRLPELRISAAAFAERPQQRPEGGAGARFSVAHLGLELCPLSFAFGSGRWFACAGQTIGRMQVKAFGFDQNAVTHRLTYALAARTGLDVRLTGPLSLRFGIATELPLERGAFSYGDRNGQDHQLFQENPLAAALDAGLVVQL